MEELEMEVIESREMDPSHEVVQVLATDTTKCELGEGGKDSTCHRRRMLVCLILGKRPPKWGANGNGLEPCQRSQACGHCVRRNISSGRDLFKMESDELTSRQEELWQCWKRDV